MGFWTEDLQPMLEVFQSETTDLMGELSEQLLAAERDGAFSADGVNRVFRAVHTIKSAAAVMGLDEMSACTHRLEDLLQVFRASPERLEGQLDALLSLLYSYQDYIRRELGRTGDEDFAPGPAGDLTGQIEGLLDAVRPQETVAVRVRMKKNCLMEAVRGEMLLRRIRPLCRTLRWEPAQLDAPEAEYAIRKKGLALYFTADDPDAVREKLERFRYTAAVEPLEAEPASRPAPMEEALPAPAEEAEEAPAPEPPPPPDAAWQAPDREEPALEPSMPEAPPSPPASGEGAAPAARPALRRPAGESKQPCTVSWQDVAALQDLLGELITVDGQLAVLAGQNPALSMLDAVSRRYHNLLDHLGETAQRMAMTTLSAVSQQLYRTVRDICRREGKQIRLQVTGEQTLADRAIIDRITPALIHLVRNAADHGVEPPEERRALGKPDQGLITLDISADSGLLTLRVRDDGRGLGRDAILAAAGRLGLLQKAAEDYTEGEVYELLLKPGFSTTASATDISGRGVGLDVVRTTADALGGALRIESVPGLSTAFSMQVPVSSTSLDVLGFQVGGMVCLLPVRNVRRVDAVGAAKDALFTVDGRLFYGPDAPIPVLRLPEQAPEDDACLVTLDSLGQPLALLTGDALERMTVVERPLPPPFDAAYKKETGVQGCCLLGDGRIGLTVSVERLIELRRKEGAE